MIIETLGIIGSGLAMAGCWLNNKRRIGCFAVWIVSNTISAALHCSHADLWPLMLRDVAFIALAVHGWRQWSKGVNGKKQEKTGEDQISQH